MNHPHPGADSAPPGRQHDSRLRDIAVFCGYVALTFLLYGSALGLGFLGDDWYFVWKVSTRSPLEIVAPAFDPSLYHYVPLGEMLLWLELALFGLGGAWWHAVNLVLHAANAWLVFKLATRLGLGSAAGLSAGAAFVVLFQSYESILWVSGIFYILATTFFTFGLAAYASFLRGGKARWYAAYLGGFAGAILTIEGGATLPAVAGLMEVMGFTGGPASLRGRVVSAFRHQIPALVLFVAYWMVRSAVARSSMQDVPAIKVAGTFVYSLFGVAALNLPPLYELLFSWKKAGMVFAAVALGWTLARGDRLIRFAVLGYLLAWCPYYFFSGFNTRYFYLPGVFAAILGAAGLCRGFGSPSLPAPLLALAAVLATAVVAGPYRAARIREWQEAAEITRSALAAVQGGQPTASASSPRYIVAVDVPDSLGTQWGPAFPAYVFRNGLPEAIALSTRPSAGLPRIDYVASGRPTRHVVKDSAASDAKADDAARLVFEADDPRQVSFRVRRGQFQGP